VGACATNAVLKRRAPRVSQTNNLCNFWWWLSHGNDDDGDDEDDDDDEMWLWTVTNRNKSGQLPSGPRGAFKKLRDWCP
jgi:hypothetical protein